MTQLTPKTARRRGRIFPELTLSPEELAKRKAEDEQFYQRCWAIFQRLLPELMKEHYNSYIAVEPDSGDYFIDQDMEVDYNWYIAIELNSGDYLIDQDKEIAHQKARDKYPNADHCVFCLNESGATGRI